LHKAARAFKRRESLSRAHSAVARGAALALRIEQLHRGDIGALRMPGTDDQFFRIFRFSARGPA